MKISVVIPAYNSSKTIRRAVESVLNQSRLADEIIVVDDGSKDDTAAVVKTFGDRVRLLEQPNGGASAARNTGIRAATGDWIAFLDADDEWLPEKLVLQSEILEKYPSLVWCYTDLMLSDHCPGGYKAAHPVWGLDAGFTEHYVFRDYFQAYILGFFVSTITVMVRRDVFDKVGLFVPGMRRAQDNDMWYRIAYQYPEIGYVHKALAIYHRDTPGSSTKVNIRIEFMIELVERHLQLSAEHGRQEAFLPCISHMLYVWIRELAGQRNTAEAKELMRRYGRFLSQGFIAEMRFRLAIPFAGPALMDLYLWLKDRIQRRR